MKETKPKLILMVGIPGSGKSTWVEKNFNLDNQVVISSDDLRKTLFKNINIQSHNDFIFQLVDTMITKALYNGYDVILDTTNVKAKNRRKYVDKFSHLADIQAVIFETDVKTAFERIQWSIEMGLDRSDVPLKVIERMYQSFKSGIDKFDDIEIIDYIKN